MTVERDGERVEGQVVFRERPAGNMGMQLGALLVGLSFLWFGAWAFLTAPSGHSIRLMAMGLATGVAVPGPDLGTWNGVRDHIQLAGMVLLTLLLLRFFLFFPKEKRIARGHVTTLLVYAPWMVLLGCLVTELIYHPRFYHSFGGYYSILMLVYSLSALVAVAHTWFTHSRAELRSSGMGLVLSGVAVAVGGLILWFSGWFLPLSDIPGWNWFPLLIAVIPLGMALGVRKHARETGRPGSPP